MASGLRRGPQLVEPVKTAHAEVDQSHRDQRHQDSRHRRSMRDLQRGKAEDVKACVQAEYWIVECQS